MGSCRKKDICAVFSYSQLLHLANWETILSLCEGGYFSEREDVAKLSCIANTLCNV